MVFVFESRDFSDETGTFMRRNFMGDDEERSPFRNAFISLYWFVQTSTTLGFGDIVPTTMFGQLCSSITVVIGMLFLALPIAILGTNYLQIRRRYDADLFEMSTGPSSNT